MKLLQQILFWTKTSEISIKAQKFRGNEAKYLNRSNKFNYFKNIG